MPKLSPLSSSFVTSPLFSQPMEFAAMLLADMGADVVRLECSESENLLGIEYDVLNRGKRSVAVDLKTPEGVGTALELLSRADVLIEGFRPGVMERLGLGPDVCWRTNPAGAEVLCEHQAAFDVRRQQPASIALKYCNNGLKQMNRHWIVDIHYQPKVRSDSGVTVR